MRRLSLSLWINNWRAATDTLSRTYTFLPTRTYIHTLALHPLCSGLQYIQQKEHRLPEQGPIFISTLRSSFPLHIRRHLWQSNRLLDSLTLSVFGRAASWRTSSLLAATFCSFNPDLTNHAPSVYAKIACRIASGVPRKPQQLHSLFQEPPWPVWCTALSPTLSLEIDLNVCWPAILTSAWHSGYDPEISNPFVC